MNELRQLLSPEQLLVLQKKSSTYALWMLLVNWALVLFGFVLVIWQPHIWAVLIAVIIFGGRQLGLGILMHECAHRSFFPSRSINDWVGQWLCAAPMLADLNIYRSYHMTHHVQTGTPNDPDLSNYSGYPVTPASFARKISRDLLSLTGLKVLATLYVLYSYANPSELRFGYAYRKQTVDAETDAKANEDALPDRKFRYFLWNMRRILIVQFTGFCVLWSVGHPLLYLLWPLSWMTTYMVFTRIRNAAEHGGLSGTMTTDMWQNTRTVIARWWERLTVAPNYVNFHFEHHLLPAVPGYNLSKMHQLLSDQGALKRATIVHGYTNVVKALIGRT